MKYLVLAMLAALAACSREKSAETSDETSPSATVSTGDGLQTRADAEASFDEFMEFEVDEEKGRLLLRLPEPREGSDVLLRVIHAGGLTSGLGSNPVGLDRGLFEGGRIIAFRRIGPKLVIEQENWRYRATTDNPLEAQAVADSFARSFLWAGEIEEAEDGGEIADLSSFLVADTLDLVGALKNAKQGAFAVAEDRSFVDYSSVHAFPNNVEIDAHITLTSDEPGDEVWATAAEARAFTLKLHHSFVRLPDDGFQTRQFDPRAGAIDVPFYDFGVALDEPVLQRYARRFRLERQDPNAASGPVKKPIIFYVDPGAPEPVRSALVDGATWWADAFAAAGFEDAYRVELLPEDAHPFDVRYNVIQWSHRQTRGWSYGGGVFDPRTGEMIKAHVVLGSQRVRQDRMIFEGLAGAGKTGSGASDDPVQIALARIRQLSAHEVGHTLGFAHNFAASITDRASVMDYPAPYVRATPEGALDFSQSYGVGVGDWDKFAARWLYAQFREGTDESAALEKIIREGYAAGLKFVDDGGARDIASAHPDGSLWDNGSDPVAALGETMRVREIALSKFGLASVKRGQPVSGLSAAIVPIYLYHRYQAQAAAKLVGGYRFDYALKGDGRAGGVPVAVERQRAALAALIETLDPAALDLRDTVLNLLTPSLASFAVSDSGREVFASDTGAVFDLLGAADSAASITLGALLHPVRLARIVEIRRRNPSALAMQDILSAIETEIFAARQSTRQAAIARRVQTRFVSILINSAAGAGASGEAQAASLLVAASGGDTASPAVQWRIDAYLRALRNRLAPGLLEGQTDDRAHGEWLIARINAHLNRPAPARIPSAGKPTVPPGSPIGSGIMETCWHCD